MPFAAPTNFDQNDPNNPNKNQQGGVNISGESTSFATNVPGQGASTGGKQQGSGQYANIQSYLDANKQQGDQMGQKVTDQVGAQAEDATQKINNLQSQAPKVDAYDPNAAIKNVNNLSDADKAQYKEEKKTGGYTGPATVDQVNGYQDAQKAASTASQNVKNAGTEQGQQTLLRQTYDRPQYSAGENRLDQTLLQNSSGSRANLENLSKKYSGIDSMFNNVSTNVGNAINAANAQALANKQAFAPAEQAATKALIDPITGRLAQAQQNAISQQKAIDSDLSDDALSQDTLKALGLNAGTKLWNTKLSNYVTDNQTPLNENMIATNDERQKYNALMSLFDQSPTVLSANDPGYKAVSFNNDQFQKDLAAQEAAFDDYANRTTASGSGRYASEEGMGTNATASGTLQDYLSGKSPNIAYSYDFHNPIAGDPEQAAAIARQNYLQQIQDYLNQQNYNRAIKEG